MHNIRNTELLERIGNNLKEIREQKGFSQEKLAVKSGVTDSQIYRIEHGKVNTTVSTIEALVKALGCDYNDLFK